jgi:hypothetical protein
MDGDEAEFENHQYTNILVFCATLTSISIIYMTLLAFLLYTKQIPSRQRHLSAKSVAYLRLIIVENGLQYHMCCL